MEYFVKRDSVVREIWGKSDTILFIFAGAAAEFALNKAVDWLYFTGRLPADPLGRLFSTVTYARKIVFSEREGAYAAIDTMRMIHAGVEAKRGVSIPNWAYQDVLFMLIDYSIRAYELLERQLANDEKREVFEVFHEVGSRMGIKELPDNFEQWLEMRAEHLKQNLQESKFTIDLYQQYQLHLGSVRYKLLREAQMLVVPVEVNNLLHLGKVSILAPVVPLYKLSRKIKLDWLLKTVLFPSAYKADIRALDNIPS